MIDMTALAVLGHSTMRSVGFLRYMGHQNRGFARLSAFVGKEIVVEDARVQKTPARAAASRRQEPALEDVYMWKLFFMLQAQTPPGRHYTGRAAGRYSTVQGLLLGSATHLVSASAAIDHSLLLMHACR